MAWQHLVQNSRLMWALVSTFISVVTFSCRYFSTGVLALIVVIVFLLGQYFYEFNARAQADSARAQADSARAQADRARAQADSARAAAESRAVHLQKVIDSTIERIQTHGLPQFATGSGGYSSASRNELHADAAISDVLVLPPLSSPLLSAPESLIWAEFRLTPGREICWKSESDVQHYVRAVIVELNKMAGLDLYCSNEVSIVGMRPDIWVIVLNGRPVGILEVKKPKRGILEAPAVAGQILDYLRVLRFQFGVRSPCGIVTTYEQWRVFHLPDDDNAATGLRMVEAAPVINGYGAAHVFTAAIVAALRLMRSSVLLPLPTALPLELQTAHAYMRVDKNAWSWMTFAAPITLQYNKMTLGNSFYLVSDLGAGAHGHAWLACSNTGHVCALKIARSMGSSTEFAIGCASNRVTSPEQQLKDEAVAWNLVNKGNCPEARLIVVAGKPALRLPFVQPIVAGECDDKVKQAVLCMAHLGVWHRDLQWRHVRKSNGHVIFIDFGNCEISVPASRHEATIHDMLCALGLNTPPGRGEAAEGGATMHPRRRFSSIARGSRR
jgi:hypothetical protein